MIVASNKHLQMWYHTYNASVAPTYVNCGLIISRTPRYEMVVGSFQRRLKGAFHTTLQYFLSPHIPH